VRDLETAEICIRSALTGHLVLSTLHTNDAPSAVSRLIDIGIEPYLLAPSLLLVVAQRLLRKLCPDCKEAYESAQERARGIKIKADLIYKPKGCAKCNQLGYRGRLCIAEVMKVDEKIQPMISEKVPYQKIREVARASGMQSLYESALKKVEEGVTSLEEALSITIGDI
jgi:type IV pilus assembly protein PilB